MRRKSDRTTHRSRNRDILDDLETESYTAGQPIPPVVHRPPVRVLPQVEDRRRWAPGSLHEDSRQREAPRDVTGRKARIVHKVTAPKVIRGPGGKPLQSRRSVTKRLESALPAFAAARHTIICLKRKARRSVLFAFKQTGKGSRSPRKRNEYSDVEC